MWQFLFVIWNWMYILDFEMAFNIFRNYIFFSVFYNAYVYIYFWWK